MRVDLRYMQSPPCNGEDHKKRLEVIKIFMVEVLGFLESNIIIYYIIQ